MAGKLGEATVIEQIGAEYSPDAVRVLIDDCMRRVQISPNRGLARILILLVAMMFKFRLTTGPT